MKEVLTTSVVWIKKQLLSYLTKDELKDLRFLDRSTDGFWLRSWNDSRRRMGYRGIEIRTNIREGRASDRGSECEESFWKRTGMVYHIGKGE